MTQIIWFKTKSTENAEIRKTIFPKEIVQIADQYKLALNKIMTTQE